jgi:phosphoribosylanthranilate isomerase
MTTTKIKASSIANLTDARYFAAWNVEWLGFNFSAGTSAFIAPTQAKAIQEWVDGPKTVGEFDLESSKEILAVAEVLPLDLVQVGMYAGLDTIMALNGRFPIIKELVFDQETTPATIAHLLDDFAPHIQFFLFNFDKNGISWQGIQNDKNWTPAWLRETCRQYPVLLSMAIPAEQAQEVLDDLQPAGVNLYGGDEEKVGVKSFDELDAFLEQVLKEE